MTSITKKTNELAFRGVENEFRSFETRKQNTLVIDILET